MRLLTFRKGGVAKFGLWKNGKILDSLRPTGWSAPTRPRLFVQRDVANQQMIQWASQGITPKPGDIIFTGTPPGVGFPKGKFLKGGDMVEAEIEGVG